MKELSGYPPGTIVITSASLARFTEFSMSLLKLQVPEGTRLIWKRGVEIALQLNDGIRNMYGAWVWILGDDHTFDPDLLLQLLDRQVDVIVPMVPSRSLPFRPVIMHGPYHEQMKVYHWDEIKGRGLMTLPPRDYIGTAGMLIQKPVLDAIGDPWFQVGKLSDERLNEDLWLCDQIHKSGYSIHLDRDHPMGHIGVMEVYPEHRDDGGFDVALRQNKKQLLITQLA